jgi:DNA repair protein RecN (Recombination protein N)
MIYDEIDSGVSGQVALEMGRILQNLSKNHQVILITHSPQVASFAQEHLFVAKSDQNGITSTKVNVLSKDEHIEAIAMMLSTNPPTKAALANAQELVAEALAV